MLQLKERMLRETRWLFFVVNIESANEVSCVDVRGLCCSFCACFCSNVVLVDGEVVF